MLQTERMVGTKTWGPTIKSVNGCGDMAGKEKSGQGT